MNQLSRFSIYPLLLLLLLQVGCASQAQQTALVQTLRPVTPVIQVNVGPEEVYPSPSATERDPIPTKGATATLTPTSIPTCTVLVVDAGNAGNAGNLNFRACPGVSCNVITWLPSGTVLQVLPATSVQDGETWVQVVYGKMTGWVNQRYCR